MHKTALASVVAGLAVLPLLAQEPSNYTMEATAQVVKDTGVTRYEVTKSDHPGGEHQYEVRLLGPANEEKATVHIKEISNDHQVVTVREPGKVDLIVTWDRTTEQLRLTMRGRTGIVKADRANKQWVPDRIATRIKAERIEGVLLAGAVLDDVVNIPRMKLRKPISDDSSCEGGQSNGEVAPADFTPLGPCGTACTRSSWQTSRQFCCNEARLESNLCCWNQWCTGCTCWATGWPMVNGCDSSCWVGNYFCLCTTLGYACTGPA